MDSLNCMLIPELSYLTLGGEVLNLSDYLHRINVLVKGLKKEKLLYVGDMSALREIENEIHLLHELKNSTLRFNSIITRYHKAR